MSDFIEGQTNRDDALASSEPTDTVDNPNTTTSANVNDTAKSNVGTPVIISNSTFDDMQQQQQQQQIQSNSDNGSTIPQDRVATAPADYFGHQESPDFTTQPLTSFSPSNALSASASHTPDVSSSTPTTAATTTIATHMTPSTQPSSTLTSALNNSNNNIINNQDTHIQPSTIISENMNANANDNANIAELSSQPSPPPATESLDPVASYSAWRKKKDTETLQGTQPQPQAAMESFLKQHSAYDVLPVSYRQIVLDTTLLVKKALSVLMQYNIVSAPLWDSTKRKFAGMLTATDFINLIQFYYSHSSYSAAIREMDQFQISQLRDVEKLIGVPPPELFSLHPLQSLYDACQLLVESRAHRLPLVDVDSETGEEMIVSVLTQYRILKFIAMNYQDEKTLRQPLSELKIGIYTDLAVADLSSPVMSVIDMFVKRRISSVPIVDEDGVVLNVFETVDVMTLVKAGVYRDLDLCVAEALLRRPEDFAGVHTCTLNDSLSSIFGTIRKSQVHRLIVVDSGNKLKGIVSLSDIMRYLIKGNDAKPSSTTNTATTTTASTTTSTSSSMPDPNFNPAPSSTSTATELNKQEEPPVAEEVTPTSF